MTATRPIVPGRPLAGAGWPPGAAIRWRHTTTRASPP